MDVGSKVRERTKNWHADRIVNRVQPLDNMSKIMMYFWMGEMFYVSQSGVRWR